MSTRNSFGRVVWIASATLLFAFWITPLRAVTVEVENDDDEVEGPPTPTPAPVSPAPKAANPQNSSPVVAQPPPPPAQAPAESGSFSDNPSPALKRARVSDNVGFYYFIKAGYVADPSTIPSVGKVGGNSGADTTFSTPKKTYIEATSDHVQFSPDDLLVVYRAVTPVEDPHMGELGYQVENLAIVKVLEGQRGRCLAQVIKSFSPFRDGDLVTPYETEVKRWKRAQIKKALPTHPIQCLVTGGERGIQGYEQMNFIYLSAGTKKGVIEGQLFKLKEIVDTGFGEAATHVPKGEAQIVFAGPDCSTAQILRNNGTIEVGFEAEYQP